MVVGWGGYVSEVVGDRKVRVGGQALTSPCTHPVGVRGGGCTYGVGGMRMGRTSLWVCVVVRGGMNRCAADSPGKTSIS